MYQALGKIIFSMSLLIMWLIGSDAFALNSQSRAEADYSKARYQSSVSKQKVYRPWVLSQSSKSSKKGLRSRSDVMNEVKKRYDAKVLKISLNSHTGIYNVRILLPNGKVRLIQISQKR